MKIFFTILAVLLFVFLDFVNLYAQAEFQTGAIGVRVSSYGRIRAYAPELDNIQQLERLSALVGTGPNTVFDYYNDWDTEEAPILVGSPQKSDFEIYGSFNNVYSGLPPNILAKLNVYGWNMGKFIIVKYVLINRESGSIDAINGLEVIPSPDNTYGAETAEFLSPSNVVAFYRSGSSYTGFKYLDGTFTSLTTFDWYSGYTVDSDLWNWLNHGSIDTLYTSFSTDGIVTIPGQNAITIASGDSATLYVAYAVGADQNELLASMDSAEVKFNQNFPTTVDEPVNIIPEIFSLEQNYPNPFNPSTTIDFTIDKQENITLKVYNVLGQEVETLVNEILKTGEHTIKFSAKNLTSGVYYYTLTSDSRSLTRKMIVLR